MCLDQYAHYLYYLHTVQSVTLPSQNPVISRLTTTTQNHSTCLVPSYMGCWVVMWTHMHTHNRSMALCLGFALNRKTSTRLLWCCERSITFWFAERPFVWCCGKSSQRRSRAEDNIVCTTELTLVKAQTIRGIQTAMTSCSHAEFLVG